MPTSQVSERDLSFQPQIELVGDLPVGTEMPADLERIVDVAAPLEGVAEGGDRGAAVEVQVALGVLDEGTGPEPPFVHLQGRGQRGLDLPIVEFRLADPRFILGEVRGP